LPGEEAKIFNARDLYGGQRCKCGGHRREGGSALPGEVRRRAGGATVLERASDKAAEVSEVADGIRKVPDVVSQTPRQRRMGKNPMQPRESWSEWSNPQTCGKRIGE